MGGRLQDCPAYRAEAANGVVAIEMTVPPGRVGNATAAGVPTAPGAEPLLAGREVEPAPRGRPRERVVAAEPAARHERPLAAAQVHHCGALLAVHDHRGGQVALVGCEGGDRAEWVHPRRRRQRRTAPAVHIPSERQRPRHQATRDGPRPRTSRRAPCAARAWLRASQSVSAPRRVITRPARVTACSVLWRGSPRAEHHAVARGGRGVALGRAQPPRRPAQRQRQRARHGAAPRKPPKIAESPTANTAHDTACRRGAVACA